MAVGYSMATGANTPITYFYPMYFLALLIHRQIRDDENCEKKYVVNSSHVTSSMLTTLVIRYGKDWIKYKKLVPYRIIPYVY
jgi:hypothetical protein